VTQKQDNTTTMFETTLTFLDKNESTWKGTAAFLDAVTRAKEGTAHIRSKTGQQQSPTEGITGDKAQVRDDLEERLLAIADAIAAFAAKTFDNDLAAKVEMTKSSLDRLPESDLVLATKRVSEAADANLAALAPYGVTDANKKELDTPRLSLPTRKNPRAKLSSGAKSRRSRCRRRSALSAASFAMKSTR
jgi:hypothetical protein